MILSPKRHRFFLIVGDEDESRAGILMQALDFRAQLHPQFRVQIAQGFVHQEDFRDGAPSPAPAPPAEPRRR